MATQQRTSIQLVILAAASLYIELAVIRFATAEVLYLGYFSNFVLISAFLGLGLGFLSSRRELALARYFPFLLLFLFALVLVSPFDVRALKNHHGVFFFGNIEGQAGLPGALLLAVLFCVIVGVFASVGRMVGRVFGQLKPLRAYTLDILGSLIGVALFTLQSMAWSGPVAWIITGTLMLGVGHLLSMDPTYYRRAIHIAIGGVAVVLLLLSSRTGRQVIWSTYQKLEYGTAGGLGMLYANSVPHQRLQPASRALKTYYRLPWETHVKAGGSLDRVLIIGAGTGTDVATGLASGAKHIDAVEIDEAIQHLGSQHHMDRPYDDPRVHVHIDDGRAFLRQNVDPYDLILFALPDSLMRISPSSNVRLESYLFTLESLRDARSLLKKGGSVALYNQYRWEWLRNKISAMLEDTFDRPPKRTNYGDTTVFIVGERIEGHKADRSGFVGLPTDDWPFVYMQQPGIHWLYIGMMCLLLLLAGVGVVVVAPAGTIKNPDWPFFFMGAAFLLLETKSISFFSLLFGTTWMVNSMAFFGILLSVLVANLVVSRFRIRRRAVLFVLLFFALGVAYMIPTSTLLGVDSLALRYITSIVLVFSPVFLANLVFSREFRDVDASTSAFGWNLLGAVAGGGLEYFSLLIGHRNLLCIVAVAYLLVAVLLRRASDH